MNIERNKMKQISINSKLIFVCLAFLAFFGFTLLSCSQNQNNTSQKINLDTNIDELELVFKDVLVMGISPGFEPFEYFDGDKVIGFDIDLANLIADSLGNRLEFVHYNYSDLLKNIANNASDIDCGMSGIVVTEERMQQYNFTEPYLTTDLNMLLVCRKNSDLNENNIDEAINNKKIKVGAWYVSSFSKYIKDEYPNISLVAINQVDQVSGMLDSGQIDVFVADDDFLSTNNNREKYKILKNIPKTENIAIAVSKNKPNLLDALNKIIKIRKEDGSIDKLYKKYVN